MPTTPSSRNVRADDLILSRQFPSPTPSSLAPTGSRAPVVIVFTLLAVDAGGDGEYSPSRRERSTLRESMEFGGELGVDLGGDLGGDLGEGIAGRRP